MRRVLLCATVSTHKSRFDMPQKCLSKFNNERHCHVAQHHLNPKIPAFNTLWSKSKSEAVSWSRAVECARLDFHLDAGENTGEITETSHRPGPQSVSHAQTDV